MTEFEKPVDKLLTYCNTLRSLMNEIHQTTKTNTIWWFHGTSTNTVSQLMSSLFMAEKYESFPVTKEFKETEFTTYPKIVVKGKPPNESTTIYEGRVYYVPSPEITPDGKFVNDKLYDIIKTYPYPVMIFSYYAPSDEYSNVHVIT